MKKILGKKFEEYGGLVTYIILFTWLLLNLPKILNGASSILSILSPFILGFAIAFVLNILMKLFEKKVLSFLDKERFRRFKTFKRPFAILLTIFSIIFLITELFIFIIPQLADSISTLTSAIPEYLKSFENFISGYVTKANLVNTLWNTVLKVWKEILQVSSQLVMNSLSSAVNITVSVTSGVVNFILAVVFAVYMLASKEILISQIRKVLYVLVKKPVADKIVYAGKVTNEAFSSFISGQCIEAVIIGALCFSGMIILRMPYALLISVMVGVTSLIPIFGAFIGTIPSAFIILIIDPMQAVWFVVFIIVLQQIEGNFIYPRVV